MTKNEHYRIHLNNVLNAIDRQLKREPRQLDLLADIREYCEKKWDEILSEELADDEDQESSPPGD